MSNDLCLVADLFEPVLTSLVPSLRMTLGGIEHDLDLAQGMRAPLAAEILWRDGKPWLTDLTGRGISARGRRHRAVPLVLGDALALDVAGYRNPSGDRSSARVRLVVARRLPQGELETELPPIEWQRIVTASRPGYRQIMDLAMAATSSAPVWIMGESGTGKELAASAIHAAGAREGGPFEVINCAAMPENLIESELFGVERGAFTGALKSRAGAFARANGGTIFLDEIGELPLGAQSKLLRVLESGEIRPVGGDRAIRVDVRVVCATWRDLEEQAANGLFRHDLLHRLWVLRVEIPPLRERSDDIAPLLRALMRDAAGPDEESLAQLWPDEGLLALLQVQAWPGNVRELKNSVQRVIATRDPRDLIPFSSPTARTRRAKGARRKREHIATTLELHRGNRSLSARALGVSRSTFYRWLNEVNTPSAGTLGPTHAVASRANFRHG